MPTTFFDLPRELRDAIYDHVLVSQTGFIKPIEVSHLGRRSGASLPLTPNTPLRYVLHAVHSQDNWKDKPWGIITISLLRTNRQIYDEARDIFWLKNTFHFRSAQDLSWALKTMGQVPSRLIEGINLKDMLITNSRDLSHAAKSFRLLASRARHGRFKRFVLTLTQDRLQVLAQNRDSINPKLQKEYDDFLYVLREASDGCKYERRIDVEEIPPTGSYSPRLAKGWEESVIRDIHFAYGGRFYWDGIKLWDNYVKVDNGVVIG
ncbi:hypothetical protein PVAG01_00417 [Phlyctema vagabunda]|uniref:DUF7730 domain-containing protein n=1 Tax=Phlyctema vagabunda TaxID=108571 RepID=A0ABR4PUS8_9HELO